MEGSEEYSAEYGYLNNLPQMGCVIPSNNLAPLSLKSDQNGIHKGPRVTHEVFSLLKQIHSTKEAKFCPSRSGNKGMPQKLAKI